MLNLERLAAAIHGCRETKFHTAVAASLCWVLSHTDARNTAKSIKM